MELLGQRPTLIRGNASEIMAVAGSAGAGGRGTDSTVGSEAALEAGKQLALQQQCIVAISGATDLVRDMGYGPYYGSIPSLLYTSCAMLFCHH